MGKRMRKSFNSNKNDFTVVKPVDGNFILIEGKMIEHVLLLYQKKKDYPN